MSLNTPTPATHAASGATSAPHSAARARSSAGTPHGAGGQGAAGKPSGFAQLLQGAVDEDTTPTAAQAQGHDEVGSKDAAEEPAEHEHRAEAHRPSRDPADDAGSANTPTQAEPAQTPAELVASLRHAGLLAAARARLGVEGRARAAGSAETATAGAADPSQAGAAGLAAGFGARLAAASDAAQGIDIRGMAPTLDALPVNLAPASTEPIGAAAAAGADFSLPSLGEAPAAPAAPAEAPPAQATLAPPPGSAGFPAALGAQLNTWLKDGVQYATLELNPRDMGPIDVRIALRDGHTQVELGADVAATRAALAEALPELAEALGDVGLTLSGGSVSDQTGQHARQGDPEGQRAFSLPGWIAPARGDATADTASRAARPAQRGLIDLVA
ncbi:flagellar hook-length control protein FliK [Ideonella sp. DXS29W]|uniref:Flagellar hook-length control protein FliK n=1 Tax=Ideonella lacteola TaxID=2984193 RepID=A0ABU9BXE2_9BURK